MGTALENFNDILINVKLKDYKILKNKTEVRVAQRDKINA